MIPVGLERLLSGIRAKREANYPKANKTLITASAEEEEIMEGEASHSPVRYCPASSLFRAKARVRA